MRKGMLICAAAMTVLAFWGAGVCQGGEGAIYQALSHCQAAAAARPASAEGRPAGIDAPRGPTWLAMSDQYAASGEASSEKPAAAEPASRPFVPYADRRGPAYPGDFWRSFGRDAKELLPMAWDDTKAVFTNPCGLALMGVGIAAGLAVHGENGDDNIADHYTRHGSQLSHFWDNVGDAGGNPGTHFGIAGAMYFAGLACRDDKTYEVAKTMLSALSINGLTTLALKGMAHNHSPNGDPMAWPSGHTSSSFCMAAVLWESYGPWVGAPAYAFATFVGYERIDARNHQFSDVVSGAVIGMVIGHLVAQNHKPKIFGMDVVPYSDDRGAVGLALATNW